MGQRCRRLRPRRCPRAVRFPYPCGAPHPPHITLHLNRLEQVKPKVIFSVSAVVYNAKVHPHLPKLSALLSGLASLPTPIHPTVVVVSPLPSQLHDAVPGLKTLHYNGGEVVTFDDFRKRGKESGLGRTKEGEIEWRRMGFDWPLWVLFSSGTTGAFLAFVLNSRDRC